MVHINKLRLALTIHCARLFRHSLTQMRYKMHIAGINTENIAHITFNQITPLPEDIRNKMKRRRFIKSAFVI